MWSAAELVIKDCTELCHGLNDWFPASEQCGDHCKKDSMKVLAPLPEEGMWHSSRVSAKSTKQLLIVLFL